MKFKMALKDGFHEPINARDTWLTMKKGQVNPHMLLRFFHVQLLMLSPFAPHFCDYYWRKFFLAFSAKVPNHDQAIFKPTVVGSGWPVATRAYDKQQSRVFNYVKDCKHNIHRTKDEMAKRAEKAFKKQKAKGEADQAPPTFTRLGIFVAEKYAPWQEKVLHILVEVGFDDDFQPKADTKGPLLEYADNEMEVAGEGDAKALAKAKKAAKQQVMSFASFVVKQVASDQNLTLLETEVPFHEKDVINEYHDFIFEGMNLDHIAVFGQDEECTIEGNFE